MPHGQLTPLGRQLRSVLASLSAQRPAVQSAWSATHPLALPRFPTNAPLSATRELHHTTGRGGHTAAVVSIQDDNGSQHTCVEDGRRYRQHGWRRLKRRKRIDHLTEALRDTSQHAVAAKVVYGKVDHSHANARSRDIHAGFTINASRHKDDLIPQAARIKDLSLQRILASYIRHRAKANDYLEADWETRYVASQAETDYLQFKGCSIDDVAAWAAIVTSGDAVNAANLLDCRTRNLGPESVPTFVYLYLLRREHLPASAIRMLIKNTLDLFNHRARGLMHPGIDDQPAFLAVIRLLRHSREVWPQAMPIIVQFVLRNLQEREWKNGSFLPRQIASITYKLNKLMTVVSYSTAIHPFKDNIYQEAAVVAVLRYMAERDKPMQLNRQGYRAVIRVQLSQRKSATEKQWAELKALSWPPWKRDRTAMDSNIGLDYGVTRAGNTLARMREAGYRMLHWEKTAQIYTGWDIDRTPTIQMRALLQQPSRTVAKSHLETYIPWAARITGTRTIQEAWACYLAWEDAKLPHDQDVYLAMFQKLFYDQMRAKQQPHKTAHTLSKAWPILPGDTREVSPLPPSTHLYTYTRTPPPTLDSFYAMLRSRDVVFEDHCLNFLVVNAPSLHTGLERLRNSCIRYPALNRVLTLDGTEKLSDLPLPVFRAAIELYTRFARSWMVMSSSHYSQADFQSDPLMPLTHDRMNSHNPFARALELLRICPVNDRTVWNSILLGLVREQNLHAFGKIFRSSKSDQYAVVYRTGGRAEVVGAINASRVLCGVMGLARKHNVYIDSIGFRSLCIATENGIVAAWTIMQDYLLAALDNVSEAEEHSKDVLSHAQSLIEQHLSASHGEGGIVAEFKQLVGQELATPEGSSGRDLPRLLTIPNPAVLHHYIRALGWLADYNELLNTVQWMREFRVELAERRSQDRLGENTMRKAIIAIRVFLERSWQDENVQTANHTEESTQTEAALRRLQTPAPSEVVEAAREVVNDVDEWLGWATDEEVERYIQDKRFQRVQVRSADCQSS